MAEEVMAHLENPTTTLLVQKHSRKGSRTKLDSNPDNEKAPSKIPPTLFPPRLHVPHDSQPPKGEEFFTLGNGCPILHPQSALHVGHTLQSPLLIQDTNLISVLANFNRERIPERPVHARGAGAHGTFEVTHDITSISDAAFLSKIGKKTPLFARFSIAAGEKGSSDSVRDARGFAFKLYTEQGNLDWVFLGIPVFPIRDPGKFASFVHALERNPQNNLKDASNLFDFFNNNIEAYNSVMYLFTDQTTSVSYRFMDIFSVNLYKFTKADGSFKYVKIHMKTNEGIHNLTATEATTISGVDPDYMTRDLFLAIEQSNFPSWTVYAQVVDPRKAEKLNINIFDATRLIPEDKFPLIPFGKITLDRNPENFFEEVEQAAFCPSNVVPGWDITPDPILQARLFAYTDAQRYRLGINFNQLPINRPFYSYNPTKRDGRANISNLGSLPNYIPSLFAPKIAKAKQTEELAVHEELIGRATSFESEATKGDLVQPREFWRALGVKEQKSFVGNLAGTLSTAVEEVREKTYDIFGEIDKQLGKLVEKETEKLVVLQATGEEIPGIVVGGEIGSAGHMSGTPANGGHSKKRARADTME